MVSHIENALQNFEHMIIYTIEYIIILIQVSQ